MSANAPPPPEIERWLAQMLRLTTFPLEPAIRLEQNWWEDIAGDDSEIVAKKNERAQIGAFEDVTLALTIDILRVQWAVSPPRSELEDIDGLQNLGQFTVRKEWFKDLMNRWIPNCPPLTRLALGGMLIIPVNTREEGYELLNRYLRSTEVDPTSTDFLYRLNRPVQSRVIPDLKINRLSTWVVGKWVVEVRAQPIGQIGTGQGEQAVRSEKFACTLEFDVNTDPNPAITELPRESLSELFEELVSQAVSLATTGDVRP